MNKIDIILVFIFLVVYFMVFLKLFDMYTYQHSGNSNSNNKWMYYGNYIPNSYEQVFKNNRIKQCTNLVNCPNNTMLIPCSYDNIMQINPTSDQQYIHAIDNVDEICGKDNLWTNLYAVYKGDTTKYVPQTWILNNLLDMDKFKANYDSTKAYILKKNIQQQKGLYITNNYDEILNADKKYVVVQELLQDPYVINVSLDQNITDNRKINMRFYVLLVGGVGNISWGSNP